MVNVIGLGYIGLPTALMLASHGVSVAGTDCNKNLVDGLRRGDLPFSEGGGFHELFNEARRQEITFSTEYQKSDAYIVAVPTPYNDKTKKVDASYVVAAVSSVLEVCPPDATIVIESTISPGTIDSFIRPLVDARRKQAHINVHLAHAPERIIPGNMIYELEHNNRTIGADDPKIAEKIRTLYASFCQGEIVLTDIRTAEMSKVVENTFRDINIAFANELAKICRIGGLDVHEIIRIANMHPRVNILNPGPGVGGHCISVDPWFLVGDYPQTAQLIKQARLVNSSMPRYVLTRARAIMDERGIDSVHKVGIYGLTYKADVDDVRESPTLQMLDAMRSCLCTESLRVYDPWVKDDIVAGQVHSVEELLKGTELLIVMVGHSQLQELLPSFSGISILDTCNVCENASGCDIYRL